MASPSMDRTARWVQEHAQTRSLSGSQHRTRLGRQDGQSSQQSSRTDLGAPEYGVGSNGRSRAKLPSASILAVSGSTEESERQRMMEDSRPLSRPSHHRSQSQPNSLPHERHPRPRLNIPIDSYRKAPAFVQGPPGSGYPMMMTPAQPPLSHTQPARVALRGPPSPPLQVPTGLNPKKSRPTVQRRRPSLSGATFEDPSRPLPGLPSRGNENREPRAQGQGDGMRTRARAASESRRRY